MTLANYFTLVLSIKIRQKGITCEFIKMQILRSHPQIFKQPLQVGISASTLFTSIPGDPDAGSLQTHNGMNITGNDVIGTLSSSYNIFTPKETDFKS